MRKLVNSFLREESGQSMIEYVIIMALLVVAAIAALGLLGGALSEKFNQVTGALEGTMGKS